MSTQPNTDNPLSREPRKQKLDVIMVCKAIKQRMEYTTDGSHESAAFEAESAVKRLLGVIEEQQHQIQHLSARILELDQRMDAQGYLTDVETVLGLLEA